MVQRIGGNRRKTRFVMKKSQNKRGKLSITKYLQSFNDGDRVQLNAEPAVQKGIYHFDFHGKAGIVEGKQGNCYKVAIKDGKLVKTVIVHPVHLKRIVVA